MRPNLAKRTLAEGGVALGTFVFEFATAGTGTMAGIAGADFVLYDMEHTGWGFETIELLIGATRAAGAAPYVRVPTAQRSYLSRVLDLGAMGVMVPMVPDRHQAEDIVAWSKYPPMGVRGTAFGFRRDAFVVGDIVATMSSANAETLLIAQIETVEGLANVEEIAAVEGIDVLWIGQFDLTTSMGIPGRFDLPAFGEALDRVAVAAAANGKVVGYMATSLEEAAAMIDRGFRCIAYSHDVDVYTGALRAAFGALRSRPAAGEERPAAGT
jgi:2-dehydro-3-deoxyglucarate aldolase/4-hydroxy-2-oxoheptanedioate aldolase